jgi:hypothetical protein
MIHNDVCKHCHQVNYYRPQSSTDPKSWCPKSPTGGPHEPVDPPRRRRTSNNTIQPLVVSIGDAAKMLGVSTKTLWRMIAARQIEVVTIAATKKIRVKEIERYLEVNLIPVR